MAKTKINLPSILTEDTHFYEEYKDQLQPYLGRQYISYSTASSYAEYLEDFIKGKIVGIRQPGSIYTDAGVLVGTALETGVWPQEVPADIKTELELEPLRVEGAEYERLIVIDRGEYIIVGFIDQFISEPDGVSVYDFKTGSASKKKQYLSEDYTQVILYAYAEELKGNTIKNTGVQFILRSGSHLNPPLVITNEVEYLPLEYNKKRVKYALDKIDKAVEGISKLYTTYQKIFNK